MYDAEQEQIFTQAIMVPAVLVDMYEAGGWRAAHMSDRAFCKMHNRAVIAWIDNEAAGFAASKGTAASPLFGSYDQSSSSTQRYQAFPHLDRASCSNPADDPSRGRGELSWNFLGTAFGKAAQEVVDAIVKLTKTPYAVLPSFE